MKTFLVQYANLEDQDIRVTYAVWNKVCDSVLSVVSVDCGLPSADVDSIFPTVAADSFFLTLWSDNVDFALSFDDFESIVDEADVGRFVT